METNMTSERACVRELASGASSVTGEGKNWGEGNFSGLYSKIL